MNDRDNSEDHHIPVHLGEPRGRGGESRGRGGYHRGYGGVRPRGPRGGRRQSSRGRGGYAGRGYDTPTYDYRSQSRGRGRGQGGYPVQEDHHRGGNAWGSRGYPRGTAAPNRTTYDRNYFQGEQNARGRSNTRGERSSSRRGSRAPYNTERIQRNEPAMGQPQLNEADDDVIEVSGGSVDTPESSNATRNIVAPRDPNAARNTVAGRTNNRTQNVGDAALLLKIKTLEDEVKELQKQPKKGTAAQNQDLAEKNKKYKKLIAEKDKSLSAIAKTNATLLEENKNLARKFGGNKQIAKDTATKEEIIGTMGNSLNWTYRRITDLELDEPEIINLLLVLFLESSGSSQYKLIARFLNYSSVGIQQTFYRELKTKYGPKPKDEENIENPNLDLETPKQKTEERSSIKPPNPKRLRLDAFDDVRDGYPKNRYINETNKNCAFIREGRVSFIAATDDRDFIRPHIIPKSIPCGITSCSNIFKSRKDLIAPVVICSPEDDPNYGKKVMACAHHFEKSLIPGEEYDLVEAAVYLENSTKKPEVARTLFADETDGSKELDQRNEADGNKEHGLKPTDIYYSDEEENEQIVIDANNLLDSPFRPQTEFENETEIVAGPSNQSTPALRGILKIQNRTHEVSNSEESSNESDNGPTKSEDDPSYNSDAAPNNCTDDGPIPEVFDDSNNNVEDQSDGGENDEK